MPYQLPLQRGDPGPKSGAKEEGKYQPGQGDGARPAPGDTLGAAVIGAGPRLRLYSW